MEKQICLIVVYLFIFEKKKKNIKTVFKSSVVFVLIILCSVYNVCAHSSLNQEMV